LHDGRQVGTEAFTILQSGNGPDAVIIARGTISLDTAGVAERLRTSLRVDGPALRPVAYDVTVHGDDERRIAGRIVGSRFSAQIVSPSGEQMREYLASEGAVLVDEGVVHHFYFLARRVSGGATRIPIIVPRASRQISAQVMADTEATTEVAGRRVAARHIVIAPAGGAERHLWVDDRGRVLRFEVPAQRFTAIRTAVP